MVKLELKKPIDVAGEHIAALEFGDLTVKMIREIGMPFSLDSSGKATTIIDANAVAMYVHKLCKVPPSTVDQLSPQDFMACTAVVMGFFGD
jgi:hypothetical protein